MKLRGYLLGVGAVALVYAFSSCDKGPLGTGKESKDEGGSEESVPSTVSMSGTLALSTATEETAASLVEDAYNLYCVTFTEVPGVCKVDVGGDGKFSKECEDFAGKAFGCFLRQGSKTLAAIEFDLGSALNVGGGALVFAVNYDPETGLAFAKVDTALSSSLAGASGGTATTMDLNGTWKIGCGNGGDAEIGDCAGQLPPEGFNMAFSTFKHGEADKLAMWASSTRRDVCLAGGSEAMPNFRITFDGKETKFDYSSKEAFESSVESLFVSLPKPVQDEVVKFSKARGGDFCSMLPEVGNCKIAVPTMVKVQVPTPDGMREEMRPEGMPSYESAEDYTGELVKRDWKCALKPELVSQGVPPCGGNMPDPDNDGFGGGSNYVTADGKPLTLVCKLDDDREMHFPVMGATKEAALKASTQGNGSDCGTVKFAGRTVKKSQAEEIRRATYELFRVEGGGPDQSSEDPAKMCERIEIKDNFTFASCKNNPDQEACHLRDMLQMYGLELKAGKLAAKAGANFGMDSRAGDVMCPNAAASFKQNNDHGQFSTACRQEIVAAGGLVAQLRLLMKGQMLYRPMSQAVICGRKAEDDLRIKLLAAVKDSCVAEVDYHKMCFESGACETTLACRGSSNNGKCVSEDGTLFTGRINGRDELMDLKMLVDGAFSMASSSLEKYYRFSQESNKPVACTFAKQFVINARKVDDNTFNGVVSQAGKQSCESDKSEGSSLALDDGPSGGDGGKGPDGEGGGEGGGDRGGSFSIPITAVRQ